MAVYNYYECREYYDEASRVYSKLNRSTGMDVIAGMILINSDKKKEDIEILDAGCGTGIPAKKLIELGFRNLTLLDQSPGMVEQAKIELATEIQEGYVHGVHEASLPLIPFPDNSFDVINLSVVLPNVKGKSDGSMFPGTNETLIEARRVLRPKGLITILTITPFVMNEAVWYGKFIPRINDPWAKIMPTVQQFNSIFAECKIQCLSQLRLLGREQNGSWYTDVKNVLKPEWRDAFPYFVHATESEIIDMENQVREMERNGTLDQWFIDNDKTDELGYFTCFICQPR